MPNPETSRGSIDAPKNQREAVNRPYNPQEVQRMYHRVGTQEQSSRGVSKSQNLLATLYGVLPGSNNTAGGSDLSQYIGITEGSDPEKIREFHKAAGLTAGPETPWCMSFVQYVLRHDQGLTDAQIGAPTASAADGLKMGQPVAQPSPGDIVVVPGEGPSGKHIGICSGPGKYISGNTGNKVAEKPIPGGAEYRHIGGGANPGQQMAA